MSNILKFVVNKFVQIIIGNIKRKFCYAVMQKNVIAGLRKLLFKFKQLKG